MTSSKFARRCTSAVACVAIAILIAVIVFVWVQFSQGAFKPKQRYTALNMTAKSLETTKSEETATSTEAAGTVEHSSRSRHKEYVEESHLEGLGHPRNIEFVKPLKMSPLPLHDHDIIFDKLHNNHDKPILRHHSGHFRHKSLEVWDPHPRYEIDAFGRKLLLELEFNDKFLGPDLHITHVWDNYTERVRHDSNGAGCFYTGKVSGDDDSDIAVSLCNGMTGYIRTSTENYYIEPAEKPDGDALDSFLHRIKKIPHEPKQSNNVVNTETQSCATHESDTIVEDSFPRETVVDQDGHIVTKRQIILDEVLLDRIKIPKKQTRIKREIDYMTDFAKTSHEYFVKVLIVVDKTAVDFHNGDQNLTEYILILMAHVSLLFKDASIGNSISVSVVNILFLKDQSFYNSTPQNMLRKFCEWQKRNTLDRQHDVAILFTRDTICRNSADICDTDTLGVAEVASMCSRDSGCAIVRDQGLATSYTIAHEIGHVLSMPHDDQEKCKIFNIGTRKNTIMSRTVQNNTKPWTWSECSRHYVSEFLESERSKCLLRPPLPTEIQQSNFIDMLPGEIFEVNKQCELEHSVGYKICTYMPRCASLWCAEETGLGCRTQNFPWADGTACGHNRWCHQGKCIARDRTQFTPIDGAWGPWQPWGPCSRTCGGGIQISQRHCNNPEPINGGSYCTGKSVRYLSCNTEDCDPSEPDFREIQCALHNGITKNLPNLTSDIEWVPKYGLIQRYDLCKLYCRPKKSNAYYMLKEKVADGTKCGLTSFDICVNGICRPGGCDNKLESKKELDYCGVCGGDNSACEEITGTYNISNFGYNRIVRIPKGSLNLDIRQKTYHESESDDNYLALVDGETGAYILNGNHMVTTHEENVVFGGLMITYSGSKAPIERITTQKKSKLTRDLVVEVLSVGKVRPPDVSYKYVINRDNAPRYGWRLYQKEWSKCNSICSGTQYMRPVCTELATNDRVPDTYCSDLDIKGVMQTRDCHEHCQLTWNIISKGACTKHCGKGIRNVYYNCMKVDLTSSNSNHGEVVDLKHCSILSTPPNVETCYGPCDSTRWDYSEWSECTRTCGGGTQRRTAVCVDGNNQTIDESHCDVNQRILEQICNTVKCPIWTSGDWTPCSVTCGRGYRTKPYYCHVDGLVYNPIACDHRLRPIDKEECIERPCDVAWTSGPWSECSVTCGEGYQKREVKCNSGSHEALEEHYCLDMIKPNSTRVCYFDCRISSPYKERFHLENEILDNSITEYDHPYSFSWNYGPWSHCSKSCESGLRTRKVACRNKRGEENEKMCEKIQRPPNRENCNTHPCPAWNFGGWGKCDSNCERHRQVSCQESSGAFVEDNQCEMDKKPPTTEHCDCRQLPNSIQPDHYENRRKRYRWKVGKWKQCSNTCGKGIRRRQIECEDTLNDYSLVDQYCNHLKKPKDTKPCERYNCRYTWIDSYWSACSATCGLGIKTRNVTCHKVHAGGAIDPFPLPDLPADNFIQHRNYCDMFNKPKTEDKCLLSNCDDSYVWQPGPWKECSQPCGKKGRQVRLRYCVNKRTNQRVQRQLCPKKLKPPRKRKCNQFKCLHRSCKEIKYSTKTRENKDYLISIRGRPAQIYCYKMDTPEPEEYISLHGDGQNYAEFYDKRLINIDSCPYYGQRRDNCPCAPVGTDRSGFTKFWKVRLNVTSLKIISDDFTFSSQTKGSNIPYGTAGDCYSEIDGCAQGRFSLDLEHTSFKLSSNVRWRNIGPHATSQINILGRQVSGKCGGYCGNCVPDPSLGLQVEIT